MALYGGTLPAFMEQQVDIPGPKSRLWGAFPHRQYGVSAWMHLANGEGALLCVDPTQGSSEIGTF